MPAETTPQGAKPKRRVNRFNLELERTRLKIRLGSEPLADGGQRAPLNPFALREALRGLIEEEARAGGAGEGS